MRNETTPKGIPYLKWAKYGLVFTAALLITFLFPNRQVFNADFQLDQNWNYPDLTAPFDVPLLKTAEQLEAEKVAIGNKAVQVFDLDNSILQEILEDYNQSFDDELNTARGEGGYQDLFDKSGDYKKLGRDCIGDLYNKGLIDISKSDDLQLKLNAGEEMVDIRLEDLVHLDDVEEFIADFLFKSGLSEAEFLLPVLKSVIRPNVVFNKELTEIEKTEALAAINPSAGFIPRGEVIVAQGQGIDATVYQKIYSYQEAYNATVGDKNNRIGNFVGYLLLTSLIIGIFLMFLKINAQEVYDRFLHLAFMMMWLVLYAYLVYIVEMNPSLSAYLIPFCIVPIVVRVFYNDRIALFIHIIIVLIASFLSSLDYEFTFLQILAGIVAIFTRIEGRNWSRFFYSMFFIFLAYGLGYLGLSLIKTGSLFQVEWQNYRWFFLSVFLTLLAYPLIPLLERLFQYTSTFSLVELSDMNQPLLKELSLKAPGTLQHSLQVANLSEAAATKIGANSLLVKVAALYHDIGKIVRPEFFIENQSGKNPHDDLNEMESAQIIIDHVNEGVRLAAKQKLPLILVDFIKTHHGTTFTEYFFKKYKEKNPGKPVNENAFRYPGPRPNTKEETILMLADSIEAAAKSLQSPDEKMIDELVEKIIANKISKEQLNHSKLTFAELEDCKKEFKSVLHSIYHIRVAYPQS